MAVAQLEEITVPASESEVEVLKQLRRECGWEENKVESWLEDVGRGVRKMWFITLPEPRRVIGMIALLLDDPSEPFLAQSTSHPKTTCATSLFIRRDHQKQGHGTAVFAELERLAREEFGVEWMTLHTEPKRMGYYLPKGYQEFREKELRYTDWDGTRLYAVYLRKRLVG